MVSSLERIVFACLAVYGAAVGCSGDDPDDTTPNGGSAGIAGRGGTDSGGSGGDAGATLGGSSGEGGETTPDSGAGPGGASGAGGDSTSGTGGNPRGFAWNLPTGFPTPVVPPDNRMNNAKVELGRHLFYDVRMSGNETQSCASCHRQELAFTDAVTTSVGSTGQSHPRNSMSLANVAYLSALTWANPLLFELEEQALVPMFGIEPVELGLNGMEDVLLERLRAEPRYQELFPLSYPSDADPFTLANVVRALGAFQRTLISGNSPYDRYAFGKQTDAISESAKRGLAMFNSEKFECFHCHSGFNFQDSVRFVGKTIVETFFHNNALYNVDGQGAYPATNTGIHSVTLDPADMGRFRAPTLRNITVTAPYMHDGSIATLDEVLDHYAAGGRTIPSGPDAGVGSASPLKSAFMIGFAMSAEERADLLAFLESLTDTEFLTNPRFSDPWAD